jgi:hypothetical protein
MRIITAIVASTFLIAGAASAQTTTPTTPKDNPRIEQIEKDKNKGNTENQNQQDIKAKEQTPAPKRN